MTSNKIKKARKHIVYWLLMANMPNFSGERGTIQNLIFIAFTGFKTTLKIY